MPNPLFNPRYETKDQPPPRAIPPIPETIDETVYAYRGTEAHGVPTTPDYPDDVNYENERVTTYEEPKDGDPPIPVRIVESGRRELRSWGVGRFYLDQAHAYQIIGRDEKRYQFQLFNEGPDTVWIAPDSAVSTLSGFPVSAGGSFSMNADDALYASVAEGDTATVYTSWEFAKAYR